MHEMAAMNMKGPDNTLPMMAGEGPFGSIAMGGMFTILKVRDKWKPGEDPGWYKNPPGTVAKSINPEKKKTPIKGFSCPMHPEITDNKASECPRCGMHLVPSEK